MSAKRSSIRALLGATALAGALSMFAAGAALAQDAQIQFDQPSQPLAQALRIYSAAADREIMFADALVAGRTAPALKGAYTPEGALVALLDGTGLTVSRTTSGVLLVQRASDPQSGSAAGDGADNGTVAALIVTAQKREENIQDVPIAISAFTEKTLQEQKIEGGFDLLKAIPNVTFSKNNFTSYNFSIRGVGTKAVSATTDPGVAVEFNDTPLISNRLFEQEYFDVERVEVLRGPQGTLHGRNATAGVINVISAKPNLQEFKGWLKGEVGNYHSKRVSAMINMPLVEDKLAVRFAGSLTDRQGYDYNSITKHAVNGRDLWSGRVSVAFKPNDRFHADLIWERFNEDDNRSRTGKQLCHRDDGTTQIGNQAISGFYAAVFTSQGCHMGSLYDEGAFGTPNGLSIPFIAFGALPASVGGIVGYYTEGQGEPAYALKQQDPYGGREQSHDMRVIASLLDPVYRAKADVVELNWQFDLTDQLTLTSQTAYDKDSVYSFQDYNRFNTLKVFTDTSNLLTNGTLGHDAGPSNLQDLLRGGIYCDPQLGCSDTMAGFDISQAKSTQFTQELRIASNFDGPLNFSAGAHYTRYNVLVDYYVMFNLLTLIAQLPGGTFPLLFNDSADYTKCANNGLNGFNYATPVDLNSPEASNCIYIDPNPVESINGEGHNYFRSKNPYHLKSTAVFGELYWQATGALKVTAGLRYTDDKKTFTPVPSQALLGSNSWLGGTVNRGYPELPDIKQHWGELSGRLGVDWKPDLSFTDDTMLYAFYSRGYKGGGANPPGIGYSTEPFCAFNMWCIPPADQYGTIPPPGTPGNQPIVQSLAYPKVFKPEFVNAYEIGAKNTLLGGAMTLNLGAYFYDYKDYQVSQIKDRTAVNENFDATTWGLELETLFAPSRNLRLNAALGYSDTKIADSAKSIDIMDRTAGNTDYMIAKPFVTQPSNCIVPVKMAEYVVAYANQVGQEDPSTFLISLCPGNLFSELLFPLFFGNAWQQAGLDRQQWLKDTNGGAGFYKNLGGNELPNAPHFTVSLGAQYSVDLAEGWRGTVRADGYWQSQSWARVYNDDPYDKLHGWYNANLSVWVESDDGLKVELYAKNILDKTPITDAFLNSDDTALTTNVFVLDPRLIGVSVKKEF